MRPLPRFNNSISAPHPFRQLAGAGLSALVLTLLLSLFLAIAGAAGASAGVDDFAPILRLLGMTATQAALSTAVSLALGIGLAWALNRLRFPGRGLVIALLSAAIVTPGIVVAFGLVAVWGRSGVLAGLIATLTGTRPDFSLFGLFGIVLAHAVLNGAYAARVLLARLDALPAAQLKLGQSLGLSSLTRFFVLDWPALAAALPGLAAVIFLLCFTSFPIVLMLGGGPANQTLEVAIYSAVRLDFDLGRAVTLALVQLGSCALIVAFGALLKGAALPVGSRPARLWRELGLARWVAIKLLVVLGALVLSPLAMVLIDGIPALPLLFSRPSLFSALIASLGIATASSLLAALLALIAALARAGLTNPVLRVLFGAPLLAYLAVPSVVLALGSFLLVRDAGIAPETVAPVVLVIANALLVLPFSLATLGPPLDQLATGRARLLRSLRLGGIRQFIAVELPLIRPELALVLALGFAFSLGDLGVIALFGTDQFTTLPLMMMRALGAYRTSDAAALAAFMLLLNAGVLFALPRLIAGKTDARA